METGTFSDRSYHVNLSTVHLFNPGRGQCGVYAISGSHSMGESGHCCLYIGSSKNLSERILQNHIPALDAREHINPVFEAAWHKYGRETFEFFVLEDCAEEDRVSREQNWMDFYSDRHGFDTLFNIAPLASAPAPMTAEQRFRHSRRMSERMKGHLNPSFGVALCGEDNRFFGHQHSEETKRAIGEKCRRRHADNPELYARPQSEETRDKIRAKALGRKVNEETKRFLSKLGKGRPNHKNRKPVAQIDAISGETIKIWPCAMIASKELGIDSSSIGRCAGHKTLKGRACLTAGGFRWEFTL